MITDKYVMQKAILSLTENNAMSIKQIAIELDRSTQTVYVSIGSLMSKGLMTRERIDGTWLYKGNMKILTAAIVQDSFAGDLKALDDEDFLKSVNATYERVVEVFEQFESLKGNVDIYEALEMYLLQML